MIISRNPSITKRTARPSVARVRPLCINASPLTAPREPKIIQVAKDNQEVLCAKDGSGQSFPLRSRRSAVATMLAIAASGLLDTDALATASSVDILEDQKGFGSRGARRGDLVLFHYVGRLEATGQVFDSTRGGLTYRDGGPGVLRPAAIALGGGPVPGICEGLQQALEGMSIGGRRTVRVPAALGFGNQTVLAPYAVVPANSTMLYEVEMIRISAVGPDQLTKGISKCGAGGANQQSENCANVSYAEFL
ncbi:hypothetical protein VOLCADRAFT_106730 [Volvox carteri f. nagariensis]|uniref:peptidylprolyl isomerase n=1 Tax=Volvox carteri f. nagariensis TaxID=3068 RepID=D8U9C4_VOLCA|nr:uncharacterized protein VOLCADRAFT_106730 [Volvox carteri f. nagariensis]EFJ43780.1 hypothetical protein VOLCADRAFT_106730 [Volvox carteri f. nagariensis]|eukprot:XP_002955261.1 hypothetical protein VOLCADRAFT_106730 [Volvox carteri f. nagariensis]